MDEKERAEIIAEMMETIEEKIEASLGVVGLKDNARIAVSSNYIPDKQSTNIVAIMENPLYEKFHEGRALFTGAPIVSTGKVMLQIEVNDVSLPHKELLWSKIDSLVWVVSKRYLQFHTVDLAKHATKLELALFKICQFTKDDDSDVRRIIEELGWTGVIYPDEAE